MKKKRSVGWFATVFLAHENLASLMSTPCTVLLVQLRRLLFTLLQMKNLLVPNQLG
jgi:hypothetical protein